MAQFLKKPSMIQLGLESRIKAVASLISDIFLFYLYIVHR